ncbi:MULTISPECIES: FAD-dependent monooxygenase [unclassified Moraxella]|uniref:FAD-dependent monooxygenase n=1 Tax=unclassified Moraxella TaxID=2685852 RepID=UPI00359E03EE
MSVKIMVDKICTDVFIVGGGVVGMTLAIGLASLKKQVVLIDAKPAMSDEQRQAALAYRDARVYALNLASLALFESIGVMDFVRRADYTDMKVWQSDGRGELNFAKESINPPILGSMIEPIVIDEALYKRARQADLAQYLTVLHDRRVDEIFGFDIRHDGISLRLICDAGNTTLVDTKLLVGADGRSSVVRRLSGIWVDKLDYQQTAICCAIKTDKPHEHTARQAMLPSGTLALLPLADVSAEDDGRWHSVVWTLPTQMAKEYLALPHDELMHKLALASGYERGRIHRIESVASFALSVQVAKSYTAPHTLLIGNAAHGVHPLAGQGLNLGLADVATLLQLIRQSDQDSKHLLRRYERERCSYNKVMMHGFSLINYAFAGSLPQKEPLRFIRAEMVNLVGKSRLLMNFFNKKAGGG